MRKYQNSIGFIFLIGLLSAVLHVPIAGTPEIAEDMPFNFIAYGDTRGDGTPVSSLHVDVIEDYLAFDPELIISSGDLAYHGGEWYQWLEFNETMTAVWDSGIPYYAAPGNHEMYTDDWVNDPTFTNYTLYVDYSDVAAACGGTELYYSIDYNGVHFVFINTEHYWVDGDFELSTEQWTWLEGDLGNVDNDTFVVVTYHRPAYSVRYDTVNTAAESIREELFDFFIKEDVDLIFNGHDHMYYRVERDGIFCVVTGGGGAPLHAVSDISPTWQEGDVAASENHFCNVEVNSTHMVVTVYLLNGSVLDSFFIEKPLATTTSASSITSYTSTLTTSLQSTPSKTSSNPSISTTISTSITSSSPSETPPSGNIDLVIIGITVGILLVIVLVIAMKKRS